MKSRPDPREGGGAEDLSFLILSPEHVQQYRGTRDGVKSLTGKTSGTTRKSRGIFKKILSFPSEGGRTPSLSTALSIHFPLAQVESWPPRWGALGQDEPPLHSFPLVAIKDPRQCWHVAPQSQLPSLAAERGQMQQQPGGHGPSWTPGAGRKRWVHACHQMKLGAKGRNQQRTGGEGPPIPLRSHRKMETGGQP